MIQKIIITFFLLTSSYTQASHFDCSSLLHKSTRASIHKIIHPEPAAGTTTSASVSRAIQAYLNRESMPDLIALLRDSLPAVTTPGAGHDLFNQTDLSHHSISFRLLLSSPRLFQRTFIPSGATLSLLENDLESIKLFVKLGMNPNHIGRYENSYFFRCIHSTLSRAFVLRLHLYSDSASPDHTKQSHHSLVPT